jgi:hypothetical protein
MTALYDPRILYDPATMPLVEGWAEHNNCTFVRYHWCLTEADQAAVDKHWRPLFYRHSIINLRMEQATSAGAGIPGWDPFLGIRDRNSLSSEEYQRLSDSDLHAKIARGLYIVPTGLADDPRLPERPPSSANIVQMLRDAAERYPREVEAEHAQMMAEWRALKSSWAGRAKAGAAPTLEDARKKRKERLCGKMEGRYWYTTPEPTTPGIWHEWEIVEILREEARQAGVEAAWQRAEARVKSVLGQTWGGGT